MFIYRLAVGIDNLVTKLEDYLRYKLNVKVRNKFYLFVLRIGDKTNDYRRYATLHFLPLACPKDGGFIAYKNLRSNVIAKLYIPPHAKRSSADTNKCRASEAIVIELYSYDKDYWNQGFKVVRVDETKGYSRYDGDFKYEVGKIVTPTEPFNEDRRIECTPGIHFFMTEKEALDYGK